MSQPLFASPQQFETCRLPNFFAHPLPRSTWMPLPMLRIRHGPTPAAMPPLPRLPTARTGCSRRMSGASRNSAVPSRPSRRSALNSRSMEDPCTSTACITKRRTATKSSRPLPSLLWLMPGISCSTRRRSLPQCCCARPPVHQLGRVGRARAGLVLEPHPSPAGG